MLRDTVENIAKETENHLVSDCMQRIKNNPLASINFGRKLTKEETKGSDKTGKMADKTTLAHGKLKALRLEDALIAFDEAIKEQKNSSHPEKFYRQRAEINLIQERYAEAYSLAVKGGLKEHAFLAAVSKGDFEDAAGYLPHIVGCLRSGAFEKNSLVSSFEAIHLIIFICFATKSSEETEYFISQIEGATNYDMKSLYDIARLFTGHKASEFLGYLDGTLMNMWKLSIYTYGCRNSLKNAVVQNVVVNQATVYSRISIDVLAKEVSLPVTEVRKTLLKAISSGKLSGLIDYDDDDYIGCEREDEHRKMEEMLTKAIIVKENFQHLMWKKGYINRE